MNEKILGVDLKSTAIKFVEISGGEGPVSVCGWSIDHPSPDELSSSLDKTVKSIVKKNKYKAKKAVICVSGEDVLYKMINLPQMPEKEVEQAIQFKLESALPYPLEEAVFGYYKINMTAPDRGQYYFVCSMNKARVKTIVEGFHKCGISVKDIIPASSSLKSLIDHKKGQSAAITDIGRFSTTIDLISDGLPVFCREAKIGSDTISNSMTGTVDAGEGKIEVDYNRAEQIKNDFGIPLDQEQFTSKSGLPASKIYAMMRPSLEKIAAEILRTFEYYRQETGDDTQFKSIILTGGGSRINNLDAFLSQELDLDVKSNKITVESSEPGFDEISSHLSIALGAILSKKNEISLLPAEYKEPFKVAITKFSKNIYAVSCVYAIILVLLLIWVSNSDRNISMKYKDLLVKAEKLGIKEKVTVSNPYEGYNLPGEKDRFAVILEYLQNNVPDGVYMESMVYDKNSNSLILNGVMAKTDKDIIQKLIDSIKKSAIVDSLDMSYLKESDRFNQSAYEFEARCTLKGLKNEF